jgi:hypothetical protein
MQRNLFLSGLAALVLAETAAVAQEPPATTVTGGKTQGIALSGGGAVFKGIPFAAPAKIRDENHPSPDSVRRVRTVDGVRAGPAGRWAPRLAECRSVYDNPTLMPLGLGAGRGRLECLSVSFPNICFPPRKSGSLGLPVEDRGNYGEAAFPKKGHAQILTARTTADRPLLARSSPGIDLKRAGLDCARRSVARTHFEKRNVSMHGIAFT